MTRIHPAATEPAGGTHEAPGMSEPTPEPGQRATYIARFEGGPRDAQLTPVLSLDSGQPPDILLTPGRPEWLYVRAGAPRADGSLPYLYLSRSMTRRAVPRRQRTGP
jgi:hypothetical protein